MTRLTLGTHLARVKTARAAVVPYIVIDEKLHFLLAKDQQSGDITDLGGGVKQHEFSLLAGLREFKEESNDIFGGLYDKINDHANNIALISNTMSVLFIPLDKVWFDLAPCLFQKTLRIPSQKRSSNEVSELLWVDESEFERFTMPRNKEMWGRVKRFYKNGYNDNLRTALKMVYSY